MSLQRAREIPTQRSLTDDEHALARQLAAHITELASHIGARHVGVPQSLTLAAKYIADSLLHIGCDIEGQTFEVDGQDVSNISIELRGTARPDEILVIGAHYDTIPGCPGANDNASGIAALLEIARACRAVRLERTVRFVAFVNEEPPFFQTRAMGSLVYARGCRARGERVVGMCCLETVGYYSDAPRSQRYPVAGFSRVFPTTANFVAFVTNLRGRRWLRLATDAFRASTDFPLVSAALPSLVPGVALSDHWSFWKAGYPAVMVTDTAPFRYPHYHTPADTPDKLDCRSFARVVGGLAGMVHRLAGVDPVIERTSCTTD
jgi:Zn-dependent M28 family amino/carboxypeptidase